MKPNGESGKLPTRERPFRELRTGLGYPPGGSSPARQEEPGLN